MKAVLYVLPAVLLCVPCSAGEKARVDKPEPTLDAPVECLSADRLKTYLERWGVRDYMYDDEREAFFFCLAEDGEEYIFHLRLFGEPRARFLLAAARYVVQGVPPEKRSKEFFQAMAALNYRLLLARAGWDEETKEVTCDFVVPVKGGLAYQDFAMIMSCVVVAAMETRKTLRPILSEGAAPAGTGLEPSRPAVEKLETVPQTDEKDAKGFQALSKISF